jgi:RNA recognition motif-containing protein
MSAAKIDESLYTIMPSIDPSTFTEDDKKWLAEFNEEHVAFQNEYMNNTSGEEMFREAPVKRRGGAKPEEGVSKSLILTNLPTRMKSVEGMQYELLLYFHQYGQIRDVYIPRNMENGMMKPFAFIEFLDVDSATRAYDDTHEGMILGGKKIGVEFAVKGRKTANEMRLKDN